MTDEEKQQLLSAIQSNSGVGVATGAQPLLPETHPLRQAAQAVMDAPAAGLRAAADWATGGNRGITGSSGSFTDATQNVANAVAPGNEAAQSIAEGAGHLLDKVAPTPFGIVGKLGELKGEKPGFAQALQEREGSYVIPPKYQRQQIGSDKGILVKEPKAPPEPLLNKAKDVYGPLSMTEKKAMEARGEFPILKLGQKP